jgi:SAM-dependent methyltransferase
MMVFEHSAPPQAGQAGATCLPPPTVAARLHVDPARWPRIGELAGVAASREAMDRLVAALLLRSLSRMGWTPAAGTCFTVPGLASELGVLPHYQRFLTRIVDILREDRWVTSADGVWRVERTFLDPDPDRARARLVEAQPWAENELALVTRCTDALPAVLRGRIDPLRVFFPGGSTRILEEFYACSPACAAADAIVAEAVAAIAASFDAFVPLSILEVGAGTCATTRQIFKRLESGRIEYCVTDVSSFFVARARQKLAGVTGLRFAALDIERDPGTQGFSGERFQVVVASNVLHATAQLRDSLAHLHRLLLPGGLLLIREAIGHQRVLDAIFGLMRGWWRFADEDLRRDYPLMSRQGWIALVESSGFDSAVPLVGIGGHPILDTLQLVALARRS